MRRTAALLLVIMLVGAACGDDSAPQTDAPAEQTDDGYDISNQPADAQATFASPADGDTVQSPVAVEMEASGVQIVPAGDPVAGEGHFHIAVDVGCVDEGELVPGPGEEAEAAGHYHFGDGSTEGELALDPGTYELCLQLADGVHQAFGGTDVITVTVE